MTITIWRIANQRFVSAAVAGPARLYLNYPLFQAKLAN
jgi:hypothetical protein